MPSPDRFAQLVGRHQAMVFSMALAHLRNRAIAEEVAQEVFLELYRRLGTLESDAHVTNWLRRVTAHRLIDQAREWKRKPQAALESVAEPAAPVKTNDLLLNDTLQQLVATLPQHARMIVILRFQEDLELAEIAEVMDLPVGTVKSRLQRALALLRDKLERRGVEVTL
jgi:RNA polymerase sigma-70 factor (ECF subfamily)